MEQGTRRPRQEWEAQYVSDYVAERYPGVPVRLHARLGSTPRSLTGEELGPEEERLLRVRMRWADAIVFRREETIIIEGKLRAAEFAKGLGELEIYLALLPHSPEYAQLLAPRTVGELLIPIRDPTVETIGRRKGFRVVMWAPPWLRAYTDVLEHRQTRPVRPEEAPLL